MRHTLSILVENRFGELARIVGVFSARGYNIESLTVAETLEPQISRVILVTNGNDQTVEQVINQLNKQIRVLSVTDLNGARSYRARDGIGSRQSANRTGTPGNY
jgi:acetolactate synthase-1/3 small subunit